MAETAESAAKKIRDAETKIQETTTELRALEQAPAKAGGKEASSSLHVTLTEVAGDAPSPPALHLLIDPESMCSGSASAKLPAASAPGSPKKFAIVGDLARASLKVKAGSGGDGAAAAVFPLGAVAEEKDATVAKSVEGAGCKYSLTLKLTLAPAQRIAALNRKLGKLCVAPRARARACDSLSHHTRLSPRTAPARPMYRSYVHKKQCQEALQALLKAVAARPGAKPAAKGAKGAKGGAPEPKWRKYLRLSYYPKTVARTRDAAEIAARHKNILLFFGGVFMMHWKGDELAC